MWEENPCAMMVRQLHMALAKKSDMALSERNLTLSQVAALCFLIEAPDKELSLKELEKSLQVSQPAVAGVAVRLEKKHMIDSFLDPSDKRIKRVRLTPQGEACCIEAKKHMKEFEEELLSDMTFEERETFKRLLKKANRSFIGQTGDPFL